ncbi:hypothetical protein C8Q76DRAFT_260106 [Earliella scabrosa]|nr:hypothetical protein C8Q76DRAFT_260106 [Earliella scabrosa]
MLQTLVRARWCTLSTRCSSFESMFRSVLCRSNLRFTHLPKSRYHWTRSTSNSSNAVKEYKVVLDNETLYIDQELAEALGWDATKRDSVPLTLSGWAPRYFAIARTGSDTCWRVRLQKAVVIQMWGRCSNISRIDEWNLGCMLVDYGPTDTLVVVVHLAVVK